MEWRAWCWMAGAVWLLCAHPAPAQHRTFQFYGTDQGLTNPTILALRQDSRGFLWASTEGGLFRYDGDRMQPVPARSRAKEGNTKCLYNSADGQFWIASPAGLFRWTGEAVEPVPGFEDIEFDSAHALSSDMVNLYVATAQGVLALRLRGGGMPWYVSRRAAVSVLAASDGTLWFGCGPGLCSLKNGLEVEWDERRGVSGGPWVGLAEDSGGRIWIRSETRLLVRERGGAKFHLVEGLPMLSTSHGAVLERASRGRMLIPHTAGLVVCQGEECTNHGVGSGLRRAEVLAAVEDREGSLWLGYSGHGLARLLGRDQWQSFGENEGLADPAVWRIVRTGRDELWIGTSRGLYRGSRRAGEQWRFERSKAVGELSVYGLVADAGGLLWIGTFQTGANGLVCYDPRSGKRRVYPPPESGPPLSVAELTVDAQGTLWVSTPLGVLRLLKGQARLEPVPLPVDGAMVSDIRATRQGFYVGSKKGLYIEQGAVRRLLTIRDGLLDNWVQAVTLGPDGALWVSYFSPSGITRVEVSSGRVGMRHFTSRDGLPSDVVYSQFFDASGRHWVATDRGVAVLEGDHWVVHDTSDGVVWNDCSAHAYLADADGTVWVGTSAGLARFRATPRLIATLPDTLVTSVQRNDQPARDYDFDSNTYSIALRFATLSYQRLIRQFRYRIGTDSSPWVHTNEREVRFAQLPPGSYRFEVQGEVEPGAWSVPAVLWFRVRPPWYLLWPIRMGALALMGGLGWLALRRRERRQKRVRAELEAAVAERTRDLAAATARAEQASRFKGEFLANMSHEMRTPLNGVIGLTQLALELSGQPEVSNNLKIVSTSAKGLLSLINDILDFSKVDSGVLEMNPVPFAIRPCLSEIGSMFGQEALLKGLKLEWRVEESVPEWVVADDRRLRQVLVNLVGNAIKFTSEGAVTITLVHRLNQLELAVADTGIGISPDKREIIFDAFRQADSSTSRRHGGTGLGLTISRQLVAQMGGRLWLEGESGQGSTFRFTIDAPAGAPPVPEAPKRDQVPAGPMKILVAEDNRVNQHLILALLGKRGHRVTVAANGVEALAAFERERFDLVLMDIQMPEMDGLEAVRRIRQREAVTGGYTPVVALTARAMVGDRESILAAGMDEYLGKPIDTQRLDEVLGRIHQLIQDRGRAA